VWRDAACKVIGAAARNAQIDAIEELLALEDQSDAGTGLGLGLGLGLAAVTALLDIVEVSWAQTNKGSH
jgi:hypothetical protein